MTTITLTFDNGLILMSHPSSSRLFVGTVSSRPSSSLAINYETVELLLSGLMPKGIGLAITLIIISCRSVSQLSLGSPIRVAFSAPSAVAV